MSLWQRLKRLRKDSQQKKKYHNVLGNLHEFQATNFITQENLNNKIHSQAVSQSNQLNNDALYQRWLSLARRDQDIVALTCLGFTNRQIAFKLGIKFETVKSYIEIVRIKLGLRSKTEIRLAFVEWDFSAWL